MSLRDRVVVDPQVVHRRPAIRGTRVLVPRWALGNLLDVVPESRVDEISTVPVLTGVDITTEE